MTALLHVDGYWLTRTVFQRGLALIYLIAFINAANEFNPLLGQHGLLPVSSWIKQTTFRESPSLFLFSSTDITFTVAAWAGALVACLALSGLTDRRPARLPAG